MHSLIPLSVEQSQTLTITLLHSLWQGALLAGLVAVVVQLCGRNRPNLRYGAYLSGLVVFTLCVPVTLFLVSRVDSNGTRLTSESIAGDSLGGQIVSSSGSDAGKETGSPPVNQLLPATGVAIETSLISIWKAERVTGLISGVYFLGVGLMLLRLAISLIGAQRLCRHAVPVEAPEVLKALRQLVKDLELRMTPVLLQSSRIVSPTVVGILRPTILLPFALVTSLSPEELSSILAHELAHVRRFDLWVNLFQRCVESLLFFHPAVWYLSRGISREREYCCDDVAIRRGLSSVRYAELLVRLAEAATSMRTGVEGSVGLAATGNRPSQLRLRVIRLLGLEEELTMRLTKRGMATLLVALLGGGILFSAGVPAKGPVETTNEKRVSTNDPLSEIETSLVGTWERSSFLSGVKLTLSADRKYQYDYSISGAKQEAGEWRVEQGTVLVYLQSNPDGKPGEAFRSQIVSIDDRELKLQSLTPESERKVYTYTRVNDEARNAKPVPPAGESEATVENKQQAEEKQEEESEIIQSKRRLPIGSVIHKTVNDDNPQEGKYCLDLETGVLSDIPKKYREGLTEPPPIFEKWIVPQGIDVMGETKGAVRGLIGFDMVVIPIDGPKDKLPEISEADLSSQFVFSTPGRPVPISGKGELPATYLFQTREGSRGVLQIIGFEDKPRGVKIRYKILTPVQPKAKSLR